MKKWITVLIACLVLLSFSSESVSYAALLNKESATSVQNQENNPILIDDQSETITPYGNTYLVRFFNWDGSLLDSPQTVNEGEAAVAPNVPQRDGYKFIGWSSDFSHVTENMDIYALYEPLVNYTVTINYIYFDSTIALQPVIYSVIAGDNLQQTVTTPSLPGFSPDQTEVNINLSDVQQDYTYTVIFLPATDTPYKVEYYQQDLILLNPSNPLDPANFSLVETSNFTGSTNSTVTAPTKTYTGFTSPTVMPSASIAADGSTTLKVYCTRNQYAIYFNTNGGNYKAPISAFYGATVTPPTPPTRLGYSFTGWSAMVPTIMPATDVYLTANWTPSGTVNYTLVYWSENIGSSGYDYVGTSSSNGTAGTAPVIPGSIPSGITFPIGSSYYTYNSGKTNTEKPATINGDGTTIVNVYYDRNSYTLNFNFNDSKYKLVVDGTTYTSSPYQITAKYGASINQKWPGTPTLLPGKTSDGVFIGWQGGGINYVTTQFFLDSSLINNNPYTAIWDPNSRNVTVYYNFENLTGGGYTPNYTQTVAISQNSSSWNAKSFPGFTVQQSQVPIVNSMANFYYSRNHYNITYYNNGTIDKNITNIAYEESISGSLYNYVPPRPSNMPSDYVFSGWYTTAQGYDNTKFNFTGAIMPAYNLILYARWDKPQYTASFIPDNGSPSFTQTVVSQGTLTEPAAPTKPGYVFGGWYLPGSNLKYVFNFPVTSNMTLTARWVSVNNITYDVVYMKDGAEYERYSFGSKSVGDTVTATAITIPNYLPDVLSKSLTLEASDNEIVFYYTPFTTIDYSVRYVNTNNIELLPEKSVTTDHASITENYINIPGYHPNFYQQTLQMTSNVANNVLTFVYTLNEPVDYKVRTFMENIGGGYTMSEVVKSAPAGSRAEEIPPDVTGFVFQPQISQISRIVASNGSTVLSIYYNRETYRVNFDVQGNGSLSGITNFENIPYGSSFGSVTTVPIPVPNPGYFFNGWQPALPGSGDLVTGDATYTAVFLKDDSKWATVKYNGNTNTGGTMNDSVELLIGSSYTLSANQFTKSYYDFVDWDTSDVGMGEAFANEEMITVTGDMTLYAQWTAKDTFSVVYLNNGSSGSVFDSTTYYEDDVVTVKGNSLVKPGYLFDNWKTQDGVIYDPLATFQIAKNMLLTAQWVYDDSQWATIDYDKNNVNATGSMSGDTVLLNTPYTLVNNGFSYENYTFTGWNTSPDGQGDPYTNMETLTPTTSGTLKLYAQWQENPEYVISYNSNNGTGDMVMDTPGYVGTSKTIFPQNTFSYTNYDFIRWDTLPNGTGSTYLPGSSIPLSQDLNLYAIWRERNKYTITYDDGYSTGSFSSTEYADADGNLDIVVAENPFLRLGYQYKDWSGNAGSVAYPGNIIYDWTSDATFTAEWDPLVYNIFYELDEGTVNGVNPNSYTTETPTFDLINPTKPGYTFTGWSTFISFLPRSSRTLSQHVIVPQGSIGNMLFVAHWERDDSQWSTITFANSDSSKGVLSGTLSYEGLKGDSASDVVYPSTLSYPGYSWYQWSSQIPQEFPEEDLVITGYWKDNRTPGPGPTPTPIPSPVNPLIDGGGGQGNGSYQTRIPKTGNSLITLTGSVLFVLAPGLLLINKIIKKKKK